MTHEITHDATRPLSDAQPLADDAQPLRFPPGTRFQSGGGYFRVMENSTRDRMQIQDMHTGEIRISVEPFLGLAVDQGEVTVLPEGVPVPSVHLQFRSPGMYDEWIDDIPVSLRSDAAIKVMLLKGEWINRLKRHKVTNFQPSASLEMKIHELERKHGEKCPYRMHTLYKTWRQLKRSDGQIKVIYPRFDLRGGAGQSRLQPEVDTIIQKVLTKLEQPGAEKLNASMAHDEINTAIRGANIGRPAEDKLTTPSLPTVNRRFHDYFNPYELAKRNHGKARADLMFRSSAARIQAQRPLDVVMYDDTDSCVFLVDERTGLPWGRCWVTPGVDEFSRSVTGLSMGEQHRSTVTATEAVMHSLREKDHSSSDFALCQGKWHAYGNQGLIVLDNASYNASYDFQACLVDLGIEYEFARPHHPTNKTCVEYFHYRMKSEFCRNLPGWSGPKEDREMLDAGIGSAVLSRSNFRQRLFRWIVDDYSNTPMRGGKTPRQLWEESFNFHPPFLPRRMPSDELLGTIPTTLRFRDSGGLLRNLLRYKSEQLEGIRRRLGARAEVKLRYRGDNLAFIYVEDPATGHYLKVPCVEDPSIYAGLTDWQWRLVLKRARALFKGNIALQQAVEAREKLRDETKELRMSKRMRDRKRALQLEPIGDVTPSKTKKPRVDTTETIAMSDLESLVAQMEDDYPDTSPEMTTVFLGE
jgi:putative transposase